MQKKVKWYKNRSTIKLIISLLALVLGVLGFNITEESKEKLLNSTQEIISVVEQVDESKDK